MIISLTYRANMTLTKPSYKNQHTDMDQPIIAHAECCNFLFLTGVTEPKVGPGSMALEVNALPPVWIIFHPHKHLPPFLSVWPVTRHHHLGYMKVETFTPKLPV